MGPTTGQLSSGRGEWLALLQALEDSDIHKTLIIYCDYFQATKLHDYIKKPNSIKKCMHRDLITRAAHIYCIRPTGTTHICHIKSHADLLPNVKADLYAKMACALPRPQHQPTCPSDWALHNMPIILPDASPIIPFREHYHRCTLKELPHDHAGNLTIHLYLSTLPLLQRRDPKLTMHFYGRGIWKGFQFWSTYKISSHCILCKTSHPQDLYSSIAVCPEMQEFRDALAEGYGKELGKVVASWMQDACTPTGDIRNVAVLGTMFLTPSFNSLHLRNSFQHSLKHERNTTL